MTDDSLKDLYIMSKAIGQPQERMNGIIYTSSTPSIETAIKAFEKDGMEVPRIFIEVLKDRKSKKRRTMKEICQVTMTNEEMSEINKEKFKMFIISIVIIVTVLLMMYSIYAYILIDATTALVFGSVGVIGFISSFYFRLHTQKQISWKD